MYYNFKYLLIFLILFVMTCFGEEGGSSVWNYLKQNVRKSLMDKQQDFPGMNSPDFGIKFHGSILLLEEWMQKPVLADVTGSFYCFGREMGTDCFLLHFTENARPADCSANQFSEKMNPIHRNPVFGKNLESLCRRWWRCGVGGSHELPMWFVERLHRWGDTRFDALIFGSYNSPMLNFA